MPITLRVGQEADKPISLVPYSKFHRELCSDLDRHISEFLLQCNANNARADVHWHSIFPTTLEGYAKLWFYRQPLGSFPNWDTLRDAFVAHFHPIGYEDRLMEQLADIIGEYIYVSEERRAVVGEQKSDFLAVTFYRMNLYYCGFLESKDLNIVIFIED